ncbi:aminoglycoside phosphotransferase family protein [Streptomyces sp. NPDC029526]|uniref:phosphotransferase family protein n=1 Tax=Streptomyces sp. NPDC029526 TaxID=3155728 RepID=UPI0033CB44DA
MTTVPAAPGPPPAALAARARAAAHAHRPPGPCTCPEDTLADRPDGLVVRHGHVVAKAHAPAADPAPLVRRLAAAARLSDVFLAPLDGTPATLHGRPVTRWPYAEPVDPEDPDAAPWEAAATLLARLHRAPVPAAAEVPANRGPAKAARAVARLRDAAGDHPAAGPVLRAWAVLPGWARGAGPAPDRPALCHGDFHLGQLVRLPDGSWRLIDVDDVGLGAPAWDLARPAAWFACGLLAPDEWARFLGTYRAAGGPAVPAAGDPWPVLDVPARALTVQTAARVLTACLADGRAPDEVEAVFVEACARMAGLPLSVAGESAPEPTPWGATDRCPDGVCPGDR